MLPIGSQTAEKGILVCFKIRPDFCRFLFVNIKYLKIKGSIMFSTDVSYFFSLNTIFGD